ncbi:hydrogenase maturation protease [Microbulbifer magnicolonia]|uniref:hydrogenase maturation protease n=1 Tax=Microbulbifer magnicolonia TaxID=3109744 RepID=UPI002B400733|nr:hydrogenase maturation protease [Microbulbifer sp. GG15]
MTDRAIISLGNRFRGDDSVGPYILHRIRQHLGDMVPCIENGGDMTQLLEQWRDRRVCLVDAVLAEGRAVGDVIRLDGLAAPIAHSVCGTSSHGLNLAEAIELGRAVGALPRSLDIYAICGENFATSAALSPAVAAAAAVVEREIVNFLMAQTGGPPCTNSP